MPDTTNRQAVAQQDAGKPQENDQAAAPREAAPQEAAPQEEERARERVAEREAAIRRWIGDDDDAAVRGID